MAIIWSLLDSVYKLLCLQTDVMHYP